MSNVTRFGPNPLLPQEVATKDYVDTQSGGGLTHAVKIKTVDETISDDGTLHDDDTLFFPVTAGKNYAIYGCIQLKQASSVPNFRHSYSFPTTTREGKKGDGNVRTEAPFTIRPISNIETMNTVVETAWVMLMANFINPDNDGVINYQWAQNVATVADTTIEAGSWLVAWEKDDT